MAIRKSLQNPGQNSGTHFTKGHPGYDHAENLLQEIKNKTGKVIWVAVTGRTTIELPASLTAEEIELRVAKYKELHACKI